MKEGFSKRIFTAGSLLRNLGFVAGHLLSIARVFTRKQNKQLIGKILIVTDTVNGCIYCSWLDAKVAVKSGISEEEIVKMMKLEFHQDVSEYDLTALLYAQHYAESRGNPDQEMTQRLFDFYGESTARDIIIAIRSVTFGNLYFNTWRAVMNRFKGNPAPNSNVVFELIYFLLNFLIILPFVIFRKLDKNAIGNGIIEE